MDNLRISQFIRLVIILFCIGGGTATLIYSWTYLYPFLIAFIISGALQPFIKLLERSFRIPRTIAILLILTLFTCLFISFTTLIIAELIKGIKYLAVGVPIHIQQLLNHITDLCMNMLAPVSNRIDGLLQSLSHHQQSSLMEYVDALEAKASEALASILRSIFEAVTNGLAEIPASLTAIIIGALATFFLCKDWELIMNTCARLIPDPLLLKAQEITTELKDTLAAIIKAQVTLVFVSMSIILVGLFILKAPYALTITVSAGLVDIIPYIGTGIIFIPWMAYQFFIGDFAMTIGLALIYMIVILTRQFLEPKLLAAYFGVPPILLLMGLFLGYQLFGLYGIILSPIIIAFIKTLHNTGVISNTWYFIKGSK